MMDVFLLLVYLGVGEDRRMESNKMHFRDLTECNFFARNLSKRYGTHRDMRYIDKRDRVTAYCVPKRVDPNRVKFTNQAALLWLTKTRARQQIRGP